MNDLLEETSMNAHSRKQSPIAAVAIILTLISAPAFAQISKVDSVLTNVQNVLSGVAVTSFTIALIWAGFKMAFQHAKWSEISNIVIGGILVGGASGIASWLVA
jgi:type IV secretion system protein VirB2